MSSTIARIPTTVRVASLKLRRDLLDAHDARLVCIAATMTEVAPPSHLNGVLTPERRRAIAIGERLDTAIKAATMAYYHGYTDGHAGCNPDAIDAAARELRAATAFANAELVHGWPWTA